MNAQCQKNDTGCGQIVPPQQHFLDHEQISYIKHVLRSRKTVITTHRVNGIWAGPFCPLKTNYRMLFLTECVQQQRRYILTTYKWRFVINRIKTRICYPVLNSLHNVYFRQLKEWNAPCIPVCMYIVLKVLSETRNLTTLLRFVVDFLYSLLYTTNPQQIEVVGLSGVWA